MGDTPSPPPPPRSCHKLFRNLQGVIDFVLVSIDGMDGWMEPDGDLRFVVLLRYSSLFYLSSPLPSRVFLVHKCLYLNWWQVIQAVYWNA